MGQVRRMISTSCPSASDLFRNSHTKEQASHIETCPRCQALLALRDDRFDLEQEEPSVAFSLGAPSVSQGDVALVAAPDSDELLLAVVVREGEDAVTIVPLSDETTNAAEWDLLIPKDVLGYQVIAESWNRGRVFPEQVVEVIARLKDDLFSSLYELVRAGATDAEPPEAVTGPAILDAADPRLRFQDEETERVHVYWEQVLALAGVASLGELVATRRAELGLEESQLERGGLLRDWVGDLERDAIDPSRLGLDTILRLMRNLHLAASNRLGRVIFQTIAAHRGGSADAALTFARKRQGFHQGEEEDPKEFVDALLRELAKPE
jgi:hypothetical protein